MPKKIHTVLSGIFFTLFVLLLSYGLDGPWIHLHDDNGAFYTASARTHLIKGLSSTRGQDFFLSKADSKMEPYLHHPPLVSLYLAGVFYLTGHDSPLVARSAMALFHLMSFVVFFLILRLVLQENYLARSWAVLVFSVTPMSVYFGKMPNHEPLALFFILTGIYSYLGYIKKEWEGPAWLLFTGAVSWTLAIFSAWHAIFVIAGLTLHAICQSKKGASRFAVMSLVCLVTVPLFVTLQILWANHWRFLPEQLDYVVGYIAGHYEGSATAGVVEGANDRIWGFIPRHQDRTYLWRLLRAGEFTFRYFGIIPTIFTAFWIRGLFLRGVKKQTIPRMHLLVASLSLGTVVYSLLFARAMNDHPYQQFYLLPFMALASALYVSDVYERKAAKNASSATCFVILSILLTGAISLGVYFNHYSKAHFFAVQEVTLIQQAYY